MKTGYRLNMYKKIKLKKLVLKLNKENAPPGGWKPGDRVQARKLASAQALKLDKGPSIG